MAREVGSERSRPSAENCDYCRERKGRNHAAVHILKFRDREDLAHHLQAVFPNTKYAVDWWLQFWTTANQIYGGRAREKYVPLWLVYFEAHGIVVRNRAEVIMKFRGHQNSGNEEIH